MLAPKPFFSPIGKYVVHCEILRIFGRAAFASAVVSAGSSDLERRLERGGGGAGDPRVEQVLDLLAGRLLVELEARAARGHAGDAPARSLCTTR